MTSAGHARRGVGLAALAVASVLGASRPAAAHPLDIGYLRIDARSAEISIVLDLHVSAAARLAGVDPAAMDAAALRHHAEALADQTFRGSQIITEAGPCRWTTVSSELDGRTASLVGHAVCLAAPRTLRWRFPFLAASRISPTFQVLVKAQLPGAERVAIVDQLRPSLELTGVAALGFPSFVWTGVEHIGAAPDQWHGPDGWKLPAGLDHILFLLALVLAGGSLLQILGIVTGFTLGHSITLALSALDIVRPPAGVIEPLIALSIAFVAAQAVLGKREHHRWKLAACFGLIHGFGFATALNQLNLATGQLVAALFGYNLGVELGQVTIVLITAPLLLYLYRHPRFHPVTRGFAAAIFVAGMYWFFERLG